MNRFTIFESMCDAIGEDAAERQVLRLADYVRDSFGRSDYCVCADIALHSGVAGLYTELSMLCGEAGA